MRAAQVTRREQLEQRIVELEDALIGLDDAACAFFQMNPVRIIKEDWEQVDSVNRQMLKAWRAGRDALNKSRGLHWYERHTRGSSRKAALLPNGGAK